MIKDELRTANTSSTPTFLGLDEPGGLWDQLAGPEHAGEDIIIGVVDSGVWPESLSFTDREDRRGVPSATGRVVYDRMHRWRNRCQSGEQFSTDNCNNKLIGAQRFNAAWGGDAAIQAQRPWEFTSPRDYNGHGTHTASTAGGNHGVPTTGEAAVFGPISGMAPRARIAAYKALWSTQDGSTASGFTSDLVAAIDKAVADGVDVINYSVSGTLTNFADPVEIAFFNAAESGVFVSASAGNSGPASGTVAHPSPWITTVAAGTHNRDGQGSVTLGNGVTYNGPSLANAVGPAPLIDSTAAGLPGANPTSLALCFTAADNGGTPVLDPAKVAGKIVVCDRGVNARVNKSLAVRDAGGIGMILVNTAAGQSHQRRLPLRPDGAPGHRRAGRGESLCRDGGRNGQDQQSDARLRRAGAVHGRILVARPAPGWRWRSAQAGPDRPRPGHPRLGSASGQRRPQLQSLQRHVDVGAARGRPGGAPHAPQEQRWRQGPRPRRSPAEPQQPRPRRRPPGLADTTTTTTTAGRR